jgi:hypothetical protein
MSPPSATTQSGAMIVVPEGESGTVENLRARLSMGQRLTDDELHALGLRRAGSEFGPITRFVKSLIGH